uniref:Uncharacterized protein n=1 Tax=Ciona intestinalis TaxID=7719 RepID=F7BDE5_CIOIN
MVHKNVQAFVWTSQTFSIKKRIFKSGLVKLFRKVFIFDIFNNSTIQWSFSYFKCCAEFTCIYFLQCCHTIPVTPIYNKNSFTNRWNDGFQMSLVKFNLISAVNHLHNGSELILYFF